MRKLNSHGGYCRTNKVVRRSCLKTGKSFVSPSELCTAVEVSTIHNSHRGITKSLREFVQFLDAVFYFSYWLRKTNSTSNRNSFNNKSLCLFHIPQSFQFSFLIRIFPLREINKTRLAEWFKAPDLRSGLRLETWVRTPHLVQVRVNCGCEFVPFILNVMFPSQPESNRLWI